MSKSNGTPDSAGFVMMWRRILNSDIWALGPDGVALWVWLCLQASHKDGHVTGEGIKLKRGQLHTSWIQMRKALQRPKGRGFTVPSEDVVKRLFSTLIAGGGVNSLPTPRGLLVTLCNYDTWNTAPEESTPPANTNSTGLAPPSTIMYNKNSCTSSKEEVDIVQDPEKQDDEQQEGHIPSDPPQDHSSDSKPAVVPSEGPKKKPVYDESNSYHADIVALYDEFYAAKDHRPPSASAKPKVMNEVRLILVKDMADEEPDRRVPRLRAILQGAATDDFWQSKIRSLTGLRTVSQRNGCLKWENCEAGLSSGPKWTSLKPQRQRERRQEAYQR